MPRRHARAVPRLRVAARRHERQPARRARHRREDRRQAHHHLRRSRRHLRTPRRAAAQATHEPRRREGPRVQEPRDVAARTSTSISTASRPTDLAQGAFDRERLRVLFNQLEFRTLLPRILDAVGDGRGSARSRDARRRRHDRARREGRGRGAASAAAKGERVAIEARWAGAAAAHRRARGRRPATTPRTSTAISLADDKVRDALDALDGPKSPPLVVHRAKELMHGLATASCRVARPRHRGRWRTSSIPAKGSTCLEDLALRYLSLELTSPDQVEGTLDFDGESGGHETGRRVAVLDAARRHARGGARGARARRPLRADRAPAHPRARADGSGGRAHRRRVPRRARQGARRRVPPPRSRDPPARGRARSTSTPRRSCARSCSRSSGSRR